MEGERVDFTKGFFHKKRSESVTTVKEFFNEAMHKLSKTQCTTNDAGEKRSVKKGRNFLNNFVNWVLHPPPYIFASFLLLSVGGILVYYR